MEFDLHWVSKDRVSIEENFVWAILNIGLFLDLEDEIVNNWLRTNGIRKTILILFYAFTV